MQHLDRRLEHLDEFENALVGTVQAAGIGVGIGIVLGKGLQLANVDLAGKGGDVLIVLVARLCFRNRDLAQPRGLDLGDAESGDIATESFEPFVTPGTHQSVEPAARNAVLFFDHRPQRFRIEQTQGTFEHRTKFVAGLQHIDGHNFHQRLQPLCKRRFSAAHRPEQIENLLALFQALRGMPEESDDPLDGFFHAVESDEGRIGAHGPVQKNTAKASILGRVDHLRFTDRSEQPLCRVGISYRIASTRFQIFGHRHVGFASSFEGPGESIEQRIVVHDPSPHMVR